jgi:hypothetical protein
MTATERARRANRCRDKSGVRLGKNPLSSSVIYSDDEREFMLAMERYKREWKCPYPTAADVLTVARELGYRLVAAPESPR